MVQRIPGVAMPKPRPKPTPKPAKPHFFTMSVAIPATVIAIFIQVNLTENWTLLSPQHWILEKVKNVNTGRSISEG